MKDGGLALIRVMDDGEGINRADLPRAFERHATSKLRSDRDLTSVRTMGFRGEALPSIASVSHVLVTTATRQDTVGSQFTLVAGAGSSIVDAPAVPGTRIDVSIYFSINRPERSFSNQPRPNSPISVMSCNSQASPGHRCTSA